jgi:hypothetical protein
MTEPGRPEKNKPNIKSKNPMLETGSSLKLIPQPENKKKLMMK